MVKSEEKTGLLLNCYFLNMHVH